MGRESAEARPASEAARGELGKLVDPLEVGDRGSCKAVSASVFATGVTVAPGPVPSGALWVAEARPALAQAQRGERLRPPWR